MSTYPPCPTNFCGKRFALCRQDMYVSNLHHLYHDDICAARASRCRGETSTCPPCPVQMCGKCFALCVRYTLLSAPLRRESARLCRKLFALCRRYTHLSAPPRLYVQDALRAMRQDTHLSALPRSGPARISGNRFTLCWRDAHARVLQAPHICAGTRTCPARAALPHTVVQEALRTVVRDKHVRRDVTALPRTYARKALHALRARHARTCPPQPTSMCGRRFALCARYTHVSARPPSAAAQPSTYVQEALRAMWARHTRVRPSPHRFAVSASRFAGETLTCPPCPAHVRAALRAMLAGHTRMCPAHMCWTRLALCSRLESRDTHASCPPAHMCRPRSAL